MGESNRVFPSWSIKERSIENEMDELDIGGG